MTLEELRGAMAALGQPAFRAGQIYTWLHRGAVSFQEMTNLSKDLRQQLEARYEITAPQVVRKQESRKDGTVKYLWRLADGNCVETVLMRYHYGNSVCISSEVGCPMGCAFCASTLGGLVRRLRPSEMPKRIGCNASRRSWPGMRRRRPPRRTRCPLRPPWLRRAPQSRKSRLRWKRFSSWTFESAPPAPNSRG